MISFPSPLEGIAQLRPKRQAGAVGQVAKRPLYPARCIASPSPSRGREAAKRKI